MNDLVCNQRLTFDTIDSTVGSMNCKLSPRFFISVALKTHLPNVIARQILIRSFLRASLGRKRNNNSTRSMLTPIFLHELRYPMTPGNISSRKRKRERNLGSCNPFRTTVKLSIDHRHLTWPIMSSINCNSLLPCFPSAPVYIGGRDRRLPQQWTPLPFPPPLSPR